jgi:hypothetical protein
MARDGNVGFSFTIPPVCHLRIGDYIHHDVVITNITNDYSSSMWALESGEVQPLWAEVSVSFNVIGAYDEGGVPLTASDRGGFYNQRRT